MTNDENVLSAAVRFAASVIPLPVGFAEWAAEHLTVSGADWSFTTSSSWRLFRDGACIVSSSEHPEHAVDHLRGAALVGFQRRSGEHLDDPVLRFDNGVVVEVFADTLVEPWVFKLPGMTFVPSSIGE